jgi:hypothetical protein
MAIPVARPGSQPRPDRMFTHHRHSGEHPLLPPTGGGLGAVSGRLVMVTGWLPAMSLDVLPTIL